ncbi:MAG TPA: gamma-glutamylcyclotransferase family protein [Noviherbaspirillum sp.]|uniref:gamma-glutamylcyclotransferase family protein n=1 Tax=Noviherbaspirillum sp. TaxID=1926288 RepID=UPI002D737FB0|nr:gamma-glutamylcyclotransferase family protein [Noviherbaspirillum sp.]HYD96784.1 gamma-glutamylcyclotransferase family protein [Noviherbaspirillum sp.]
MSSHVFTYGSLMFPEIWTRVVRGHYRAMPARLDGHARFEIVGETYPGMVERRGSVVEGVLYLDVAPADIDALDAFEGAEYRRAAVQVRLESGETVEAGSYLYLLPQKLSESPWRPEAFQMARFIGSYCRQKLG